MRPGAEDRASRPRPGLRRRDGLLLVAAASAAAAWLVWHQYAGSPDRLLLVGQIADTGVVALFVLLLIASLTGWVLSRCWIGFHSPSRGRVVLAGVTAMLVCTAALVPSFFALLTLLFTVDDKYVSVAHTGAGDDLVVQVRNGWDADETTRVFQRRGLFRYVAVSGSGYTNCLRAVDSDSVKVVMVSGSMVVRADLGSTCQFTDLELDRD
jgi:hypothetical protein